jgi:hypothetical protein
LYLVTYFETRTSPILKATSEFSGICAGSPVLDIWIALIVELIKSQQKNNRLSSASGY